VKNGVQYTVPVQEMLDKVKNYEDIDIPADKRHKRICYVCAEDNADLTRIENEIKTMPNYFAGYDTSIYFISEEELIKNHSKMPHGGLVIRTGTTGKNNRQTIEFKLTLDSNPEFTSSVVIAYARAVFRLSKEGKTGAISVFDVPFAYLSPMDGEELRKKLL
ncbi:MAG TPA: diaminopimelate dehydrogenase, partial [Clostridia bacterium]|nr:diaminopimelate dehydrogenase [Clostridia bacterium]